MYGRYEKLLKARGKKTAEVCRIAKISPSTFSHWKNGEYEPKRETMQKIADALEFPIDYFYTKTPEMFDLSKKYNRPIYEVSAGNGRINDVIETISDTVTSGIMENMESRKAVVVGDSMLPSLRDGDIVHIIETSEVNPSDFALVRINGEELSIKHCEITPEGLWVRGENKDAFEDRFFTMKECLTLPVQVVGKAVSFERKL